MKKTTLLFFLFFSAVAIYAQKNTIDEAWNKFYENDRKGAIEKFESAASNTETAEEAYLALSILYAEEEETEKSFESFQKFFSLSKNPYPYIDVLWYTASVSYGSGEMSKNRIKFLDKLLEDPKTPGHIKADIYSRKGKHYNAITEFKKAKKEYDQIGSITNWMSVGEFENISASGFDKNYDPISKPESDATFTNKRGSTVKWFPLKEVRLDRWIDHEYYFYAGNSIIYSQNFVNSPTDQDVQFRIGVSGSVKMWLNDNLILSEEEERNNGFDSYIVETHLTKGYNRILIQIGESEANSSNFMLRITNDNGDNIQGLTFENLTAQEYKKGPVKANKVKTYAVDYFEQLVKADPSFINTILLARAYENLDMSLENRKTLASAEKMAPNCTYVQFKLVNVYQREGNRTAIAKTIEWLKDHDKTNPVTLGLLFEEAIGEENYSTADSILDELENIQGEEYEENLEKRMNLLARQDKTEDLIKMIDKGYDLYPDNYFFVDYKVALLKAKKDEQAATQVLKKYIKGKNNISAIRALSNQYLSNGQISEGIALLEEVVENDPIAIGIYSTLAEIYIQLSNYDKGIELMNKAIEIAPYVSKYWATKAKCYHEKKDLENARADYLHSIELSPTDFDSRKKIREIDGLKEDIFSKFDKIDVYQAFKESGAVTDYPDDNSIILVNSVQRVVYKGGVSEEKHILVAKVITAAGIDNWKEFRIPYYNTQRVIIEKVEVLKANGSKFEAERDGAEVVFTNLEVGDGVHIAYRLENYQGGKLAPYFADDHYFDLFYPVKLSSYSLLIDPSVKFNYKFANGGFEPKKTPGVDGFDLYVWEKKNVLPLRSEPYMTEIVDFGEVLFISSFPDWKFISNWYSDLAKTKAKSDFEVKETALEIFKDKPNLSKLEKAKLIHDYIVKNIRYSLVSFRQSGLIPQKASKVINTKVGDCKDVSTLFVALCKEAGIDSVRLMLISTRNYGKKHQLLPSIDFNHCIASVTINGKDYHVELTSDKIGFTTYPLTLNKAFSLRIYDENEVKAEEPSYLSSPTKTEDNILRTTTVTIAGKEMNISTKSVKTGDWATDMRNTYADIPETERRKKLLQSLTGDNSSVKLDTYTFKNLDAISDSLHYEYTYSTGNSVTQITGLNIFSIPWAEKVTSIGFFSAQERKYPIKFWDFYEFDKANEKITIMLPAGKVLAEVPKNVSLSCSAATFTITYKITPGKLEAVREMKIKTDIIEKEKYDEIKQFFEKVVEEDTRQLAFK